MTMRTSKYLKVCFFVSTKKSTASFSSGPWTSRIQFYKPKKLNL